MADVSVQIIDNSDLIEQATNEAIVKALEAMGLQAEGYAKMKCPVDTGNLRNSITHETDDNEMVERIGTNVEYAPYVEYGTQKTIAQPFLEPAIMNHVDEYRAIVENFLKNG